VFRKSLLLADSFVFLYLAYIMPLFTDQIGRTVNLPKPPGRILSLVPSQTELLFDLGLGPQVVGRTKFCIHPAPQVQQVPIVGGTKQVHLDRIAALQPDLIIGNKEENSQDFIEALMGQYPVWLSNMHNLAQALQMIEQVGLLCGVQPQAQQLAQSIQQSFEALPQRAQPLKTLYLIWRKPYMAAGQNTFINDIMQRGGFQNVLAPGSRYPELSADQIQQLSPQVVLLSSEPYPFKQKHLAELQEIVPQAQLFLADGELFSWYGSRLQYTAPYLQKLGEEVF